MCQVLIIQHKKDKRIATGIISSSKNNYNTRLTFISKYRYISYLTLFKKFLLTYFLLTRLLLVIPRKGIEVCISLKNVEINRAVN